MTVKLTGIDLARLPAEAALSAAHETRLIARGTSMLPAISDGDELRLARKDRCEPGDAIVFRRGGELVCHRVKSVDARGNIVTQGDNSSGPDEPVAAAAVIGSVVHIRRAVIPADIAGAFRRAAGAALARLGAIRPARAALRAALPRCCRYFTEVRAPIKCLEAYDLVPRTAAPVPPDAGLVARLFGRSVARFDRGAGRLEVHESLQGLGIEEELRRWASRL